MASEQLSTLFDRRFASLPAFVFTYAEGRTVSRPDSSPTIQTRIDRYDASVMMKLKLLLEESATAGIHSSSGAVRLNSLSGPCIA